MPDVNPERYQKITKFDSTLVENMEILSSMNKYYQWVSGLMNDYVGDRVFDIGCGNGNLTLFFIDRPFIMGLDYSEDYIKAFNERFMGKDNVDSVVVDMSDKKAVRGLKEYKPDTLITMNTFEHIKDDQYALDNAYEILEKGGRLVSVVPAMELLYSILDFEGGHYRRYTKKELSTKLRKAGFKIEKLFYLNLTGAVGWFIVHVLMKKRLYSQKAFSIYNLCVPLFKFAERIIHPPFGLSVFFVARKE